MQRTTAGSSTSITPASRRSRSRAVRVAALALVVVALGTPDPGAAAPHLDDRRAIQDLLDRRADALRRHDRRAFLATILPGATDFRARQMTMFRGLEHVSLDSLRYVARWDRSGDLARPGDAVSYPLADEVSIPLTQERYRIARFDRREAVENLYLTFVKQDGVWFVADDNDLEDLSLFSARHLWDFGPVQRLESKHFLLLGRGCLGATTASTCEAFRNLIKLAEDALEKVDASWRVPWRQRVVVLVPASVSELERILQATFDLDNYVAFASSTIDDRRGLDYAGHRILLNPAAFAGRSSDSAETILTHELLHIATRDVSGPFVPSFLDEGIADYVGYADEGSLSFLEGEVASGLFDGKLPHDFEFLTGDGTTIFRSYQKSQSAVRFLVEGWGMGALERLYTRLGRTAVEPGTARYHLDTALRGVLGIGFDEFERRWASSLTG